MTDKEFKHLSRSELIDIIYTLRKNQETLEKMNAALKEKLAAREIKIENAGSIAEAAIAISNVFEDAQKAADMYLEQIKRNHEKAESQP